MAINNTTLQDEDGSYSDWIELYNSGTNAVDLGGWYLANSPSNLTHWQFPSTNLGPNRFLVVFASNKNRRIAGAPLHTNFKLGGSGEYLALVMPDGMTKASEFAPVFPQQYADVSYGYAMTGKVTTLLASNASVRALVPSADIGTSWRQFGFDDSSWRAGLLGAGYDTSGSYAPAIGLDLKSTMLNVNASAYIRSVFNVAGPAAFNLLTLSLRYDDGFIAYLNGTEVLRRNAPVTTAWNSSATERHGAPNPGALAENFEGSATNYTLSQYGASPPPSVQPAGVYTTGKFLRLLYDGTNASANAVTFNQTAPGLFQTIVADFDFRITDAANNPADGFAFLLVPTSLYGTNGPGLNTSSQAAEEPNYRGVFGIGFDVYPHASHNDVSAHWDGTERINITIPASTIDLAAGVFHHAKVTLQYVAGGASVTVTLTRDINRTPGAPFSPIANFFIAGLNPFDCRVEFGGRSGGLNLGLDLDNCNMQFIPPAGPIAFEDFDLDPSLLVPGPNVLAIQGLNFSAGSSNFLIQPQLLARELVLKEPATYLYPATPGAWNNSAGSLLAPPPVSFLPAAGVYTSNTLTVTLAAADSAATIRYTLDGSMPGVNSPIYTNAFLLSTNALIRARSEVGGIPGEVAAADYTLLDSSLTNFSSNLPLIIIDTAGQTIPDGSKITSFALFIDTNAVTGRTSLSGSSNYKGGLGIGLHGSSSLMFPKKTYAIELDDDIGRAVDFNLLGLPAGSDWLLYRSCDDKTFMNNVLTEEIFESMGHYAVRRKYTELFLHTGPGKLTAADYQGIYIVMERIRVAQNRVNIAKLDPTDNVPPAVTGGYLFFKDKINTNDLTFTTTSGEELILLEPKFDKVTPPQFDYLTGYLNSFEAALYGSNWLDPLNGYAGFIDVDSFVDYHWIVEYSKNIDGTRISNYMNKDRNGKLKMEPIWDWDLSWGNANYTTGGNTNGWYYPLIGDSDDIWLRKLRTDPDFYQKIIDRWDSLRLNAFNPANLLNRINQLTNYLWEAQARDFACWPRLGTYVWPNPNGAVGGFDVDYVSPTNYAGIIAQFKKFVFGRYLWIDQQFVPAPALQTNGARLTLSAPLSSVYYTLDGTDPRAGGGGLSSAAKLYTGAIALTNNVGIVARAFYTNAWSAPAQAVYVVTLPALRITEINYHPAPPGSNSPYSDKDFEFIEVRNTGTNVLNLAGVHLGGGISFTFAPNELEPAGSATTNSFEGDGTPFVASRLGQPPAAYLTNDGPSGTLLCLLNTTTNTVRNRVSFQQTAVNYDRMNAQFDFRASTFAAAGIDGVPTLQDFDSEANQADGMGFALLNTAVYGTNGAGPAFAETPNLTSSIGVGFDVYNNGTTPAEPNNNHVSLHWNGAQIGNGAIPSFDMSNGKFHRAQVIVWFSAGNAYVTVRLTPDINGVPGPTETVLQNALISGAAAYQARVAFGARTGGQWAAHDLDNVNVQFSGNSAAAAGLSLLCLPVAQFGAAGPGTWLGNFTDWPRVTKTLALDLAFGGSNLVNDVSIYWNGSLARSITLPSATLNLQAGVFHQARLQLDRTGDGLYTTLSIIPNNFGGAGAPFNVCSNFFLAGATIGDSRLEFASRNGGLQTKLDLDNVFADFQVLLPLLLNPGESILVVHNLAAFTSRYGAGIRVAGEYSGSLNNAGDRLTLFGAVGEPILDFQYDPNWYPSTDGGGYTLVPTDLAAAPGAWNTAGNWGPSSQLGGSPGSVGLLPSPALAVAASPGGNTITLSWTAASGSFNLFTAASLNSPGSWTLVTNTPVQTNDQWVLTLSPPTNHPSFYRLQKAQ